MTEESWQAELREKYTRTLEAPVRTSTGLTTTYLDAIGGLLDSWACDNEMWYAWFQDELRQDGLDDPFTRSTRDLLWPVGTGQGSAVILGLIGFGTLVAAPYKDHGIPVNGNVPPPGTRVAIVDDCAFTGATLARLRAWCEAHDLIVVKEIVAFDMRDAFHAPYASPRAPFGGDFDAWWSAQEAQAILALNIIQMNTTQALPSVTYGTATYSPKDIFSEIQRQLASALLRLEDDAIMGLAGVVWVDEWNVAPTWRARLRDWWWMRKINISMWLHKVANRIDPEDNAWKYEDC